MHAIYKNAGLKSEGMGIAFSVAVDEVVGISAPAAPSAAEDAAPAEAQVEQGEKK